MFLSLCPFCRESSFCKNFYFFLFFAVPYCIYLCDMLLHAFSLKMAKFKMYHMTSEENTIGVRMINLFVEKNTFQEMYLCRERVNSLNSI